MSAQSASPSQLPWQQEDGEELRRPSGKWGSRPFAGAKFLMLSLSQEAHVTIQPGDRGWGRGKGEGAWLCLGCVGGTIPSSSLASALKALQTRPS